MSLYLDWPKLDLIHQGRVYQTTALTLIHHGWLNILKYITKFYLTRSNSMLKDLKSFKMASDMAVDLYNCGFDLWVRESQAGHSTDMTTLTWTSYTVDLILTINILIYSIS